jgi:hypothetical protein
MCQINTSAILWNGWLTTWDPVYTCRVWGCLFSLVGWVCNIDHMSLLTFCHVVDAVDTFALTYMSTVNIDHCKQ